MVIAVWRYLCIVHDDKVSRYGLQKARKVILASSAVVPLVIAVLGVATIPGKPVFLYAALADSHRSCPLPMSYYGQNIDDTFAASPIFMFASSYIPASVVYGMKLIAAKLVIIIGSNVIEGVLYAHTFIHIRR